MHQYLDLLEEVLDHGQREPNRTGIDTLTIPGAMLKFDLRNGFPAVTTKQLAFRQVKGELIGFLRGSTSLAEFKSLGCDVWDANVAAPVWQSNPACGGPDHMGRIYGTQWRFWNGNDMDLELRWVDQIAEALEQVRNNAQSRRILVTAWNPAELDQACLPPCHVLFQLLPRSDGTLHMTMYQRSCDMFLGVPFNIASYAILLGLFAAWTGRTAATLTMFLADVHIYVNHIEQVKEQLSRAPYPAPDLTLNLPEDCQSLPLNELLARLGPPDVQLEGYEYHPAIKAPMAV
jgi:thymidylate synthase